MLGCSSLLGLDDYNDQPATGGAGGLGGSSTGGAAGSGSAASGGAPTGGAAGSGGTGATGGTQPTGGAGGTGATGGTQPTGGAGGTGGTSPFSCTIGSPFTILDKAAIPGAVTNVVLTTDDVASKPRAHVLVGHDFTGTPPSGRYAHELIALRIDDSGASTGPWSVWDMQAEFAPGAAVVHTGASPATVVLGTRKSVERWTIPLDSSLAYQVGVNPVLGTMLGQSACNSGFGTVEAAAFSVQGNDERWAATCVGNGMRELWAGTQGQKYLLHTVGDTNTSLIPRVYHSPPSSTWRILWTATDDFRRSNLETNIGQPTQLPLGTATSQKVVGVSPRDTGVVAFLSRVLTTGPAFATVQLLEPYAPIDLATLKDIGGPMPPPEMLRGGTSGAVLRAVAGPTPPNAGKRDLRLLVYNRTNGSVLYNDNVANEAAPVEHASAVMLPGGKALVAWRTDNTIRGVIAACK